MRLTVALVLVAGLMTASFSAVAEEFEYQDFEAEEFEQVWERTDYPVSQTEVARTWLWGPGAISGLMSEEYTEAEDGYHQATITVAPFTVRGKSVTMAGARRAALYEAERTYRSYHPSYRVRNPFPDVFVDHEGVTWRRVPVSQRPELGDYQFVDADGEEDYADIENMLTWDVRPASVDEDSA